MKKNLVLILLVLSGMLTFAQTKEQQIADLMASANKLRDSHTEGLALSKYDKVLEIDPNNYEALHNASLMYSRVGNRFGEADAAKKSTYFRKAKDLAARAIKANGADAEGYFVMSVAMGRIALIAGSKERVAASTDIKKNAETALKYSPQHAGAWHILGRWNTKVANLSFAEKAAANMLFGGLPEGASNQNAVNCYLNALKYKPNYILYMYDLAYAYYNMSNTAKCKETLNALLKLKPVTEDDAGLQSEARDLLASL
jgi:regulator of microtubule dynamics protein 3